MPSKSAHHEIYHRATLLLFSDISQPELLWHDFSHHICDDLEPNLVVMGITNPPEDNMYDFGLFLLDKVFWESGHTLDNWPSMLKPQNDWNNLVINLLIAEQLNYDRNILCVNLDSRLPHLNEDQQNAFTCIINSVENNLGKLFFLNGPGGALEKHLSTTLSVRNCALMVLLFFVYHHLEFLPSSCKVDEQPTPCSKSQCKTFMKNHSAAFQRTANV